MLSYIALLNANDIPPGGEKVQALQAMLEVIPSYAPAILRLAKLAKRAEKKLELINGALALKTDRSTRGSLLVDKALALDELDQRDESVQILTHVVKDSETEVDALLIGKALLAKFTREDQGPIG